MTNEVTGSEIQRMIEIGWRRKWIIMVPFVIIFVLVAIWAFFQPDLYRSSSSIFIIPQEVPSEYVRSTVTTDIESQVSSISQRLTSRTKLLSVIDQLDLYPEAVKKGVTSEALVAGMLKNLSVEIPNQRDANFFIVHYIHRDPTKAMLAVSSLVSLFIEESLQVRELQAEGTTSFIEDELEKLKLILEIQEQAVQRYKAKYMGELPDQQDANLRMLANLQLQLSTNVESQRELDSRVMLLEQDISRIEGEMDVSSSLDDSSGTPVVGNMTLNQLIEQRNALRQRLATMESMYTDQHPDLVAARKEMISMEERLKSIRKGAGGSVRSGSIATVRQVEGFSLELTNLRRQLKEIKPRLASLRQEEINLNARLKEYQKRVESAPMREQQLTQLTRDYENTKNNYEELLNKRMEAQLSENLEKRQKGEKFQILEPANFPEKPFLPNRPKLMAIGFTGGLGVGIGLALLLEALFPAFYSLLQLQQQTPGVPITFGIPYINIKGEHRGKLRKATQLLQRGWQSAIFMLLISVMTASLVLLLMDRYLFDLTSLIKMISANIKEIL
jgi:polysaccharide chain length determinant protein (PEP-CTERM system associated)